jgi:uncharacterized membrane protein YphA (DoxX/SURF4 family)
VSRHLNIPGRVARPLLASIFISSGLDAVQHPEGKIKAAEKVTGPLASHLAVVPDDTATAVTINGAVQVVAGALLSFGILRRTAAVALIGSLIPTTLAGHRFWEEIDEQARVKQITQFLKNLGLLGGLVLVATEGKRPQLRRGSTGAVDAAS